jgi:hypothetical protein
MLATGTATLRFDTADQVDATILQLNEGGLTVQIQGSIPQGNHAWIRFALPGRGGDCLALGTILETKQMMLRIQFKHLFPDQMRDLAKALNQPIIPRPAFAAQVA